MAVGLTSPWLRGTPGCRFRTPQGGRGLSVRAVEASRRLLARAGAPENQDPWLPFSNDETLQHTHYFMHKTEKQTRVC